MSTKTTIVLAILLVVALGVLWMTGSETSYNARPEAGPTTLLAETTLLPKEFENPTRVACTLVDGEEIVLEKGTEANAKWRITAPFEAPAASWQVDSIVRQLKDMKYQIRYRAGDQGAPTAEQAGLAAKATKVTLSAGEKQSVVVEIGKETGTSQNYVRLGGSDDIYVVNASLASLLKKTPIQFRDQSLFSFKPDEVKQLEVADGEQRYVLAHAEADWTFESPFKARAVKTKLDGVARSLGTLRVMEWAEAEAEDLNLFGLGDSAIVMTATVEEVQPSDEAKAEGSDEAASPAPSDAESKEVDEGDAEEKGEEQPQKETRTESLRLSRISPMGEDSKVYVCRDGEKAVGTVSKSIADQLVPDMDTWRDMRLTTSPVTSADRVEVTTAESSAAFEKRDGKWVEATSGNPVDAAAVNDLLKQISGLAALSFVEPSEGVDFGFDAPQSTIRLNLPGVAEPEEFMVGGFTDPQTKRLVYVRRGPSASAAKLKVADVDKLLQAPEAYQDRAIFSVAPARIEEIRISRNDELAGSRVSLTLARREGKLTMVEPVEAETQTDNTEELANLLATLRAERVIPAAEAEGLDWSDPAVTCTFRHQPPDITKFIEVPQEEPAATQPSDEGSSEAGDTADQADEADAQPQATSQPAKPKLKQESVTPPAEEYQLDLLRQEGQVIARRKDGATFAVAERLWELLTAEYHQPDLLEFEASQAVSISVVDPQGVSQGFAKADDQWTYSVEPDLPIDPKKVTDLLLRVNDLKSTRWVAYNTGDLGTFGLDQPAWSVTVTLEDGTKAGLTISASKCEADPEKRWYARLVDSSDVFLVSDEVIDRIRIDLKEFEAK